MSRSNSHTRRRAGCVALTAVLLIVCSATGGVPAGAADRPAGDPHADAGESPLDEFLASREPGLHAMHEVVAIAPDDAVAVGIGADISVRARQWDGQAWRSIRPEGGGPSEMWGVGAISPTDVWGVGNARLRSMAQHWDGKSWTSVPTPPLDPDAYLDNLQSVDGARSRDVWAVGYTLLCLCPDGGPLVEHWDGSTWTKVEVELPYGNEDGALYGVSMISADDAWAVGWTDDPHFASLALHWDGETWASVDVPPLAEVSVLRDVYAIATDDVWAVGSTGDRVSLIHWDGTDWSRFPSHTGHRDWLVDSLRSVHAIATDDVWAVGGYGDDAEPERIRMLHWDGTRWSRVRVPNPGDDENQLYSVSGTGPDDLWAVGSYSHDGDDNHSLYLRWDGHTWTRIRSGQL